jgi:hypothetical protein
LENGLAASECALGKACSEHDVKCTYAEAIQ